MGKARLVRGVVGSVIKAANNGNISAIDKATELAGLDTTISAEAKNLKSDIAKNAKTTQDIARFHRTLNTLNTEIVNAEIAFAESKRDVRKELMNLTNFVLAVKSANPSRDPFTKNSIHKVDSKILSELHMQAHTMYTLDSSIQDYSRFKSQQLSLLVAIKRAEKGCNESRELIKRKVAEVDSVNKSIERARGD